jgi:hypothetical protein
VPFLPLLGRFSNLKRLSLHGNRIKELPVDMSQLYVLEELDISNNMLSNVQDVKDAVRYDDHVVEDSAKTHPLGMPIQEGRRGED